MRVRSTVPRDERLVRREELAKLAKGGKLALPDAIRQCRTALGLTQEEFADRFGLTRSQVSQFETGRGNPTQDTLLKIGAPFGFTLGFVPLNPERTLE